MPDLILIVGVILLSVIRQVQTGSWDIEADGPLNVCPPAWRESYNNFTSCAPAEGYFYMTGCKSAEPGPDVNLNGRLTRQEESLENCAFRCYNWNWNDLDCKYFKEPGCAGFDWYPNTGTCVMWTEVCDNSNPMCPYPSCDNVYHFNRFDCFFGKDWGAFHLNKDRTQLRDCAPLNPRGLPCTDGQQCSCLTGAPTFDIVCAENCGVKASPDLPLRLQINCSSCALGEVYGYEWSINTFIDWDKQSDTGRHHLGMAIDPDVLKVSSEYKVSARVIRILPEGPCVENAGFANYTLKMASLPLTGYCKPIPLRGVALLDEFKITCTNFTTDELSNTTYRMNLCDNFTDTACRNRLLYEGNDPDMPPTTLPPGDPNYSYKAKIKVTVSDDFGSGGSLYVTLTVNAVDSGGDDADGAESLFRVLKNLTVGIDGGDSKMKYLLSEHNEQVALSVALSTASVLNDAAEGLTTDQQQELRSDLVDTLGEVDVRDTYVAQQQVQALNEVTKSTGTLSENATSNAAALYGDLGSFLEQRAAESSSAAVDIDNLEETALLVLGGSMKVLKTSSGSLGNSANLTEFNTTDVLQLKNVAKNTLGVINGVVKALLKRRVAGDRAAVYETDVLTLKVEKVDASSLKDASFATPGGGKFDIPGVDSLLSGKVGTDNAVLDVQMTQAEENQYVWDPTASKISSNVVSLDVNTGVGERLPTDGLTDPIRICIPSTGLKRNSKSAKSNLAFATSVDSQELLIYNMTMAKEDQIVRLIVTPSFFEHTFVVVVATDTVPTYDDVFATGNATVKLLICITDGQPVGQVLGRTCDTPGAINETVKWAYQFNGEKISVVVRNEEDATEDLLIHIGSIVVVLEGASLSKASSGGKHVPGSNHRVKRSTLPPEDDPQVFQVCEEEAPTSGRISQSPQGPLIYFDTTALTCSYWNETTDKWSSEGCEVAYDGDSENLECNCTHLSSFGGKFLVAPNAINPIADIYLFATFFDNPVSVVMVITMWVLFLMVGVWARRKDKSDLAARGVTLLEDNHPRDSYVYLITVITGWRDKAGTTSTVGMYITGENGKSDRHLLTDPNRKLFGTGCEDWFLLTTRQCLGELISLDVWLDFTGIHPSWFLRQVIVRDLKGKQLWLFDHNAWIYADKKLKKVAATIKAQRPTNKRQVKPSSQFEMRTSQDLRDKHLWVSIFSVSPYSNFSRLQRLACAFSFIFTAMLTNMMFYGVVPDDSTSGELAGFTFNWGQIIIAIQSSLITVPINASLVWIFRNARLKPSQEMTVEDKVKEGLEKAKSVQRLAAELSEESLVSLTSQEIKATKQTVHLELMELARKLNIEIDDSLSSLSKFSSDSSEFVISSDTTASEIPVESADEIKMEQLLHEIGVTEPLDEHTGKTMTKHFEEVKDAIRHPQSDRAARPVRRGRWLESPLTSGWVNIHDFDDLTALLADVESRLPDDISSESSLSTLSTIPSDISAMVAEDILDEENRNQSNRAKMLPDDSGVPCKKCLKGTCGMNFNTVNISRLHFAASDIIADAERLVLAKTESASSFRSTRSKQSVRRSWYNTVDETDRPVTKGSITGQPSGYYSLVDIPQSIEDDSITNVMRTEDEDVSVLTGDEEASTVVIDPHTSGPEALFGAILQKDANVEKEDIPMVELGRHNKVMPITSLQRDKGEASNRATNNAQEDLPDESEFSQEDPAINERVEDAENESKENNKSHAEDEEDSFSMDLNASGEGNGRSERRRGLCFCCTKHTKSGDNEAAEDDDKPKKASGIPWWTIYIAWTLSILSNVISSYFIMLYGLKFGYKKSVEWLTSFFTSFLGSTIIFAPLKIVAVAAFFSYIMKSPLKVEYDSANLNNADLAEDEEVEETDTKVRKKEVIRTDPRYFQPTDEYISKINRRLHKETKMTGFLRDLVFLFIFTVTITIIVYLHIPGETYYVTKTVKDVLVDSHYAQGSTVEEVRLKDDIWEYLNSTLLPSVYNIPPNETDEAQFYLSDLTTTIIGVPRIRQLRVDHGECELPESVKAVSSECFREYSSSTEEKGDYNTAWTPLYENSTQEPNSAWVYHSAFELETTPIFAAHNTYGGGGYVAQLKSSQTRSEQFLEYWRDTRWIDRYTRAVIVEINTFHPPTQLFSATAIVFEAHASGAFTPFVQILTSKLYFYSDPSELSSIAFEINFVIFTIAMTIRELWKGCKQKKKYFQEPWNYIELVIIGLSYAGLILYMKRIFLINRTLRKYKTGKCRNVFVSFYPAVVADFTLQYVFAALITAASVRYVRFMNLNKRVLVISMAIRAAFSTVATYAFLLTTALIMFSAAGVLVMGPFCAEMNSPVEAAVSIFHLVLVDTQFEMDKCLAFDITTLKGPIYIMTIGFAMVMIGVPLLQSILDFAIVSTRHNRGRINEEYEILDFIYSRLRFWAKKY